jgi:hypothetical protein
MLPRLRSFTSFPPREQWFALRALGALALVRLALWLLPFRGVRVLVDRRAMSPLAPPDPAVARAVRRAVDRAARTIPGSGCLAQALTAELLLRRGGQAVRVSIGVAPNGTPLDAHAWVESAGVLVTGEREDLATYQTLAVFGTESRTGGVP